MKKTPFIISSLFFLLGAVAKENIDWPVLEGPYLGQEPPGMVPELFAPGIITTDNDEAYPSFARNGEEFYYKCKAKGGWLYTQETGGKWAQPTLVPFSNEYEFGEAMITPDGNTLLFCSTIESETSGSPGDLNLWSMKRGQEGWQTPQPFGDEINTKFHEAYPSMSSSQDLYFFRELTEKKGGCEIFVSKYRQGQYPLAQNIGSSVNSLKHDCDPYLAPDGSYLLLCVRDREEGLGNNDLYISFKNPNGSWTKSTHLGKEFNTKAEEITPYVTPDGKYIFFSSNRSGNYDIYWVNAKIINTLKPKN